MTHLENSSLTGWLIELGGGHDPSWVSSITRTTIAGLGAWHLSRPQTDYGELTSVAHLAASVAFSLFLGSILIKLGKLVFSKVRRSTRVKRASRVWRELQPDELTIVMQFFRDRSLVTRIDLQDGRRETVKKLQTLGVIRSLTPATSESQYATCALEEGVWDLLMKKIEDDSLETSASAGLRDQISELTETISNQEKIVRKSKEEIKRTDDINKALSSEIEKLRDNSKKKEEEIEKLREILNFDHINEQIEQLDKTTVESAKNISEYMRNFSTNAKPNGTADISNFILDVSVPQNDYINHLDIDKERGFPSDLDTATSNGDIGEDKD